jgi:hypothetical protein
MGGFFSFLLFLSFSAAVTAQAVPLPEQDLFYGRDAETLWINGSALPYPLYRHQEILKSCSLRADSFPACAFLQELRAYQPGNFLERAQGQDMLFIGESHLSSASRNFVGASLADLQAQGFTTLALEMCDAKDQGRIDAYIEGRISERELFEFFKTTWDYADESYMNLFRRAKALGLKVIGMGERDKIKDIPFGMESLQRMDENFAHFLVAYRDSHPSERLVIYAGRQHAFKSLSEEKKELSVREEVAALRPNWKTLSVALYGANSYDGKYLRNFFGRASDEAAVYFSPVASYFEGLVFLSAP